MPENITYARGSVRYIKSKTTTHFSPEQVAEITKTIEAGKLSRGLQTNLRHNKHVQEIVAAKKVSKRVNVAEVSCAASAPVCHKCGSEMVLRKAKKGKNAGNQFWGCSNFPKCRSVVEVNK